MNVSEVPYEKLVAYAANELPRDEARVVEEFLARNAEAAETVRRFREAGATLRSDDSITPPAEVVQRAKSLFRERLARRQPPDWLSALKRIVADLVFDSRPAGALAGVRGRAESYQMSFESEAADVDLEVHHTESGCRVRGQIGSHGSVVAQSVVLARPGTFEPLISATPDENGMFVLTTDPGHYDVFVAVQDSVVVLAGVEIE